MLVRGEVLRRLGADSSMIHACFIELERAPSRGDMTAPCRVVV